MRVHHLNCATLCPPGRRLINGEGGLLAAGRMVCHCFLIETNDGLVLVDTGLGLDDVARGAERLGREFLLLTRPRLDPAETAVRQVERLGFRASDVRHIIPTHLDLDHAGGLPDFPEAQVHLMEPEQRAALSPPTFMERERYRAAHFAHGPRWVCHNTAGERWFGFDCVRQLPGLPPEILLVPLYGHTRGHAGVAVETEGGWLLHAGDAYFNHGELDPRGRRCPPALEIFQRVVAVDDALRRQNQERLRELARNHRREVQIVSAHDPVELETAAAVAARALHRAAHN